MGDWRVLASCKGLPPEIFFSERPIEVERARRTCAGCPVAQPCREEARAHGEYGMWGGETDTERGSVRRGRTKVA